MKSGHNLSLGKYGEERAAEYLQAHGYSIIERNFRKPQGDIDIVALENGTLVFVEVKSRISSMYGRPEEAVTPWTVRSLTRSAHLYKNIHPELPDDMRLDAVAVSLTPDMQVEYIEVYKNISM